MKQHAVVFDLDGTLCHLGDTANPYNHDGEEIVNDVMLEELEKEWYLLPVYIIILTGRKEKDYSEITKQWLDNNGIMYDKVDFISYFLNY